MTGFGIIKGLLVTGWEGLQTYFKKRPYRIDLEGRGGLASRRGPFTVQYPEERLPIPDRFRGRLALLYDQETGEEHCVGCGLCQTACPHGVISLSRETVTAADGATRNVARTYDWESGECSFCRLCVEACPWDAVTLTKQYDMSAYDRDALSYTKERLQLSTADYKAEHPDYEPAELKRWRPARK